MEKHIETDMFTWKTTGLFSRTKENGKKTLHLIDIKHYTLQWLQCCSNLMMKYFIMLMMYKDTLINLYNFQFVYDFIENQFMLNLDRKATIFFWKH